MSNKKFYKNNLFINIGLILITFFLIFLSLFIIDYVIGLNQKEPTWQSDGLIFTPYTVAQYHSNEFIYTAKINSIGIRDHEISLNKSKDTIRIIAIGDSFTYGWGHNIEDSWVKILERKLNENRTNVEIFNLGMPGAGPVQYSKIAEKSVPLLKPDLVIIAILQGDDIMQLESLPPPDQPLISEIKNTSKMLFPHIFSSMKRGLEYQISQTWKNQAEEFQKTLTSEEQVRLENLDPEVKKAYIEGQLNPGVVRIAIKQPTYFLETMDVQSDFTKNLTLKLTNELTKIKSVCEANGAKVLVISIPERTYVNHVGLIDTKRVGYTVDEKMLVSNAPDDVIKNSCLDANITFISVMDEFRKNDSRLYFEFDGHFNSEGSKLFAENINRNFERINWKSSILK